MAEQIEMPSGLWTRVGPRKQVLHGLHVGATWQIQFSALEVLQRCATCHINLRFTYLLTHLLTIEPSMFGLAE